MYFSNQLLLDYFLQMTFTPAYAANALSKPAFMEKVAKEPGFRQIPLYIGCGLMPDAADGRRAPVRVPGTRIIIAPRLSQYVHF